MNIIDIKKDSISEITDFITHMNVEYGLPFADFKINDYECYAHEYRFPHTDTLYCNMKLHDTSLKMTFHVMVETGYNTTKKCFGFYAHPTRVTKDSDSNTPIELTKEQTGFINGVAICLYCVLKFIMQYRSNESVVCVDSVAHKKTKPSGKKHKGKHRNSVVKVDKVYAIKPNACQYVKQHKAFQNYATYSCDCWQVRGHYRHYADGRVVYIKPYKKGIKRDVINSKDTTYMIAGEQ